MKNFRGLVQKHPALSFYVLTFAISWGGILLVVGGPGALLGTAEQVERLQVFALLALFAGPSISGLLMNWIVSGKSGLRELWSRMLRWRVEGRWYTAALFLAPVLVIALLLALSLISSEFTPRIFTESGKLTLLLFGIGWGLLGGGLLEETGWTGFAVHTLLKRYSILTTGLIVGWLWGVWHFLVAFWVISGTSLEPLSLSIYLPALVFYVGSLPAYRILMVRVYQRAGESLLVAMLMHGVFSASMLIMEPLGIAVGYSLTFGLLLAASLWITVAFFAVDHKGQHAPPIKERAA